MLSLQIAEMGWPIDPALAIESRRGSFVYSRAKIGYYWENACWHPLRSSTAQGQRQWRFRKDSNWRTLDRFTRSTFEPPRKEGPIPAIQRLRKGLVGPANFVHAMPETRFIEKA